VDVSEPLTMDYQAKMELLARWKTIMKEKGIKFKGGDAR